jgi:hypothetical protein
VSAIGAGVSASGKKKAAKAELQGRQDALDGYLRANNRAITEAATGNFLHGRYGASDIFGTKTDPNAALYEPVDISGSQLDTIYGNLEAGQAASDLASQTNQAVDAQALAHQERISPGFTQNNATINDQIGSYLSGEIPQDVREQILRETASVGGQLGTPGTSANTMNRNLGLTSLDLANRGQSLFGSMTQLANSYISPLQNQMTPQSSFLSPSERLQADIRQRENQTQANLNAAMLASEADPAAAGLYNQQLQAQLSAAGISAGISPGTATGIGESTFGAGLQGAAGLFGSMYNGNQGSSYGRPNGVFGGGGGYQTAANQPTPTLGYQGSDAGTRMASDRSFWNY